MQTLNNRLASAAHILRRLIAWLGGRDYQNSRAITFSSYLWIAPLAILGGIRLEHSESLLLLSLNIFISLLSYVALGSVLLMFHVFLYRQNPSGRKRNYLLLLIGFLAGAFKGAVLEVSVSSFSEAPLDQAILVERIFTSGLAWAFGLPVFAHVATGIAEFRQLRKESLDSLVDQERRRNSLLEIVESKTSVFTAEVKRLLDEVLRPLSTSAVSLAAAPEMLEIETVYSRLVSAASKQVREISHDLSLDKGGNEANVSKAELVKETLLRGQVNMSTTLAIVATANFVSPLFKAGLLAAFAQAAVSVILAFSLLSTCQWALKTHRVSIFYFLLTCFFYASIHAWLQAYFYQVELSEQLQQTFGSLFGINFFALLTALLIGSAQRVSTLAGEDLLARLRESLDMAKLQSDLLEDATRRNASELAKYLHGYLQSQLMAIAIQLSEAKRTDNAQLLEKTLKHVRAIADNPLGAFELASSIGLAEGMKNLTETWTGIVGIKFRTEIEIDRLSLVEQVLALQVTEEAIANAYRHAQATRVQVTITKSDEGLTVVSVQDDGSGVVRTTRGLGFRNFDLVSEGKWSLVKNSSQPGSTLQLEIQRVQAHLV